MPQFQIFLLLFSLVVSGCSWIPKATVPQGGMDQLFSETALQKEAQLEAELEAIQRKGDVLRRATDSPFIRVINVYVAKRQLSDGTYLHPNIVTVPLILRNETLTYSQAAVDKMFEESARRDAPSSGPTTTTPSSPSPAIQPVNAAPPPAVVK